LWPRAAGLSRLVPDLGILTACHASAILLTAAAGLLLCHGFLLMLIGQPPPGTRVPASEKGQCAAGHQRGRRQTNRSLVSGPRGSVFGGSRCIAACLNAPSKSRTPIATSVSQAGDARKGRSSYFIVRTRLANRVSSYSSRGRIAPAHRGSAARGAHFLEASPPTLAIKEDAQANSAGSGRHLQGFGVELSKLRACLAISAAAPLGFFETISRSARL
jgi:hypothetical protein